MLDDTDPHQALQRKFLSFEADCHVWEISLSEFEIVGVTDEPDDRFLRIIFEAIVNRSLKIATSKSLEYIEEVEATIGCLW